MWTHIKETSKSALLALCELNSPVTGEFPTQRASNAEKTSIWWRHHAWVISFLYKKKSNLIGNSFSFHSNYNEVITTKFCKLHDFCSFVACAKMCGNLKSGSGITWKQIWPLNGHHMSALVWNRWQLDCLFNHLLSLGRPDNYIISVCETFANSWIFIWLFS